MQSVELCTNWRILTFWRMLLMQTFFRCLQCMQAMCSCNVCLLVLSWKPCTIGHFCWIGVHTNFNTDFHSWIDFSSNYLYFGLRSNIICLVFWTTDFMAEVIQVKIMQGPWSHCRHGGHWLLMFWSLRLKWQKNQIVGVWIPEITLKVIIYWNHCKVGLLWLLWNN